MTSVTVKTTDGISHSVPERGERGSGFRIVTSCGLEFQSWNYAGRRLYGRWKRGDGSEVPQVSTEGVVDCMSCLVARQERVS